jgi:hypothetical protein
MGGKYLEAFCSTSLQPPAFTAFFGMLWRLNEVQSHKLNTGKCKFSSPTETASTIEFASEIAEVKRCESNQDFMNKIFIMVAIIFCEMFCAAQNGKKLELYNLDSKNEITAYFKERKISVEEYALKRHTRFHVVAAYPYSGNDTIEV